MAWRERRKHRLPLESCFVLCAPPTHRRYRDIDSDRVITSGTEHGACMGTHHLWRCQGGGALPEPVKLRERV